jgi:hypothetical protein
LRLPIDGEDDDGGAGPPLVRMLEDWAHRNDGLCDAYRLTSGDDDLALVQGETTIVLRGRGIGSG